MTAKCFLNDGIVDQPSAGIALSDRGFTLGDGVFETLRVRNGGVVDVQAHLERLTAALDTLAFPHLGRDRDLARHLEDTRAANGMAEGVLRLTVTRGQGVRGLAPSPDAVPTVCITAAGLPSRPDSFTAVIATRTRRNEFSPLSRIKSLGYLDNIIALGEANERGADDAVLLNGRGNVVCFTAANLVARFGKEMATPPAGDGDGDGALPGTVRRRLMERMAITEKSLTPADLERADEVVSVNSLGVRRLDALGGTLLPQGRALFDAASEIYRDLR